MKSIFTNRNLIIEITSVLYIILFLYTAISKIMDYNVFKEQLAASPLLSGVVNPIAIGLPLTELILTVLLIVPRWRLTGLYASAILMLFFIIYIIVMLTFSDKLPCSCGGIVELMSWKQHIMFNTTFLLLALGSIKWEKRARKQNKEIWGAAFSHTA